MYRRQPSASNSKGLTLISNVAAVYSSFFESITYGSQSITIETCSKVFSIKPALKATELTKVFASCT